jgi:pseudouridine-5'-phosphate glycosidase
MSLKPELSPEIELALIEARPVVALESTVLTHGLPYPENLQLLKAIEQDIRILKALPATIALIEGRIKVGLSYSEAESLITQSQVHKISARDIGPAIAMHWSGGTTVAATAQIAHTVGIKVFATGGIGGVHRQPPYDISADLTQLARTPIIVICSGAKAILDIPATVETLETLGVPVVGYRTDDFPAFYSLSSGLPVSVRAESSTDIVAIATAHWENGQPSAVLVVNPPPVDVALPKEILDQVIEQALAEAEQAGVRGQASTPFLLARVSELTGGSSLRTNLAFLRSNARLAAEIAKNLRE